MSARHPAGPAANALWEATRLGSRELTGDPPAAPPAPEPTHPAFVERRVGASTPQRRIGKYTVVETVGEGAMGIVYKALDPDIQRTVALKTIQRHDDAAASTSGAANALRFRNEAQAAGRLHHPGIVSVFDYGEEGDESYIAMEYVQGPTLAECARRERLPLADVLSIVCQLLEALHCAHSQNVWHRDIKPGNLILTAAGQLKVADFGIARIDAHVLTQEAWSMGSPGYMAPECYTGAAIDHRVDLYACGVLLFELLTGCRPFRGSPGAVMYQALHEAPPPLAQALPGCAELAPFEAIVARAMAKQREQRYSSALDMRDALKAVAGSLPLEIPARVNASTVQSLLPPEPAEPLQKRAAALTSSSPSPQAAATASATRPPALAAPRAIAAPVETTPRVSTDSHAQFMAALTQLLQPHLGPIAALIVKQAAARHQGAAALVVQLAHELPDANDHRRFLAQAQKAHPLASSRLAHTATPPAVALPVLGASALTDALVAQAEPLLVKQLGPIGKLLVRRAAKTCSTREAFLHALADAAADLVDRDQLLGRLNRLKG